MDVRIQFFLFVLSFTVFAPASLLLLLLSPWPISGAAAVVSSGYLDLDELKESFYSVKILDTPISLTDTENLAAEKESVHVSSKYGQKYVCHYHQTPSGKPEESEEKIADLNITDILEPMRGNCLIKIKDWWTYEFCYGQVITQFHLQNGKKSGETIVIGKYESDKRWLPEDLAELKKSTVNRYHTQSYVNGSVCDLTKKPRKAEVRFSCVEGEVDRIGAVAEMEACSYIIFIYTSKICHHPYLRPPIQATASAIECQPIVSQATYDHYMAQLQVEADATAQQQNEEQTATESEQAPTDGEDKELDPLDTLLEGLAKDAGDDDAMPDEISKSTPADFTERFEKLEEQKKELLDVLAKAVGGGGDKQTIRKYKETIREFVSAQFDDIIAEAKSELDQGDKTSDSKDIQKLKDVMSSVLDSQLNGLEELEAISEQLNEKLGPDATDDEDEEGIPELAEPGDKSANSEHKLAKPQVKTPKEVQIEFIQPQQLEVEMIDIDDIDETSEYYNTAKKAKKQQSEDNNQVKTVIAVLRPMQEKGTRQEERKHQQLQQNYGRRWDKPHDEL